MTEQATQVTGETIDGADWPTREQLHVMEAAAVKFGSVAVERVKGTDSMRMTTPEGIVLVSEDGERIAIAAAAPLDYLAVTRLRKQFKDHADRLRIAAWDAKRQEACNLGAAAYACQHAEAALFEALNTLAHYADDERALGVLHDA